MPEGDTIHKVAGYLAPRLEGRRIRRLNASDPAMAELCAGRLIRQVLAKGKHLFIELDNDWVLRSHLGMYGSWHRYREGEEWHKPRRQASLEIATEGEVYVCFNAKEVELIQAASVRRRILDTRLGPDLTGPAEIDLAQVVRRARELPGEDWLIADLLLDQRVAAGIGNVYKSEVLFIEGILPQSLPAALSDAQLQRCYATAADLLRRNLGGGPRTTRFEADRAGRLWVYGRAGLPCLRCGERIGAARLGKDHRPTFWCPACQT
jgi:endonuclease-8